MELLVVFRDNFLKKFFRVHLGLPSPTQGVYRGPKMKPTQPLSTSIRQIEFELHKAEHGMGMPFDAERIGQLRNMLREARKRKLSRALAVKREQKF